jgi:hypothetical protein
MRFFKVSVYPFIPPPGSHLNFPGACKTLQASILPVLDHIGSRSAPALAPRQYLARLMSSSLRARSLLAAGGAGHQELGRTARRGQPGDRAIAAGRLSGA